MFWPSWWTVCSNYTVSPWTDPLTGLKQDSLTGEDYTVFCSTVSPLRASRTPPPTTIMFWLKMLCQYSRRLVATAGNCEFLALLDEEEFSTRQTWCITSFLSQITFTCWGVVDSHDDGKLIFYLSLTMFKSNDYLQDRIKEQRKAPVEPHEHRSPLPPTWQCGCEIWRGPCWFHLITARGTEKVILWKFYCP